MLIIKVKNGKVTTQTRGSVAEIDKDMAAAHRYLMRHATFSDGVNGKILNGKWANRMNDDGVVAMSN